MTEPQNKRLAMLKQMASDPNADPFVLYGLAMEYRKAEAPEAALEWFTRLRNDHPDYLPTFLMAGQLLIAAKRNEEAVEWLQAGLELAQRKGDAKTEGELEQALDEANA